MTHIHPIPPLVLSHLLFLIHSLLTASLLPTLSLSLSHATIPANDNLPPRSLPPTPPTSISLHQYRLSFHGSHCHIRQCHGGGIERTLQYRRRPGPHIQRIATFHLIPQRLDIIGHDGIPSHGNASIESYDARIDIAPAAQIVVYPGEYGALDQYQPRLLGHVVDEVGFEARHGCQRPGAHGRVRELPGRAVGVDLIQVRAAHVAPPEHQRGRDVSLISE